MRHAMYPSSHFQRTPRQTPANCRSTGGKPKSIVGDLSTLRWLRRAVAAIALLGAPATCAAQQGPCSAGTTQVSIAPGLFTGAELNALSDSQLGMYAAGYVDALQAATMIGVTEQCRRALQTCVLGRRKADFVPAVRTYLRENPDRHDERSNTILYNALFSHCLGPQ